MSNFYQLLDDKGMNNHWMGGIAGNIGVTMLIAELFVPGDLVLQVAVIGLIDGCHSCSELCVLAHSRSYFCGTISVASKL